MALVVALAVPACAGGSEPAGDTVGSVSGDATGGSTAARDAATEPPDIPGERPWTAVVERGAGAPGVPDVQGVSLMAMAIGPALLQLAGTGPNVTVGISLPMTEALQARTYVPTLFTIAWTTPDVHCFGEPGLEVVVTAIDPLRARYAGPFACRAEGGTSSEASPAQIAGVLNTKGPR